MTALGRPRLVAARCGAGDPVLGGQLGEAGGGPGRGLAILACAASGRCHSAIRLLVAANCVLEFRCRSAGLGIVDQRHSESLQEIRQLTIQGIELSQDIVLPPFQVSQ